MFCGVGASGVARPRLLLSKQPGSLRNRASGGPRGAPPSDRSPARSLGAGGGVGPGRGLRGRTAGTDGASRSRYRGVIEPAACVPAAAGRGELAGAGGTVHPNTGLEPAGGGPPWASHVCQSVSVEVERDFGRRRKKKKKYFFDQSSTPGGGAAPGRERALSERTRSSTLQPPTSTEHGE